MRRTKTDKMKAAEESARVRKAEGNLLAAMIAFDADAIHAMKKRQDDESERMKMIGMGVIRGD